MYLLLTHAAHMLCCRIYFCNSSARYSIGSAAAGVEGASLIGTLLIVLAMFSKFADLIQYFNRLKLRVVWVSVVFVIFFFFR